MTEEYQDFEDLNPPDLSELMSQIMSKGKDSERLVFVEYEPATRAFYDHLGLPERAIKLITKKIKYALYSAKNCKEFLERLIINNSNNYQSQDIPKLEKSLIKLKKEFPDKIAEIAEWLFVQEYGRESEIILPQEVDEMEDSNDNRIRFLLCLARSIKGKDESNDTEKIDKDIDWLRTICEENNKDSYNQTSELYNLLHWFFQCTPQALGKGGCSDYKTQDWQPVENGKEELMAFPAIAGLEILFGMRIHENNDKTLTNKKHLRINIFLDTGEYAGQMIVFTENDTKDTEEKELFENAIKAARLVRRILPEIRYARYTNAILKGQTMGVPDHVIVRYLTYLIPLDRFYVRVINDYHNQGGKGKNRQILWKSFWDKKSTIFIHRHNQYNDNGKKDKSPTELFDNFKPVIFKFNGEKVPFDLKKKYKEKEIGTGFIDFNFEKSILLGFSTDSTGNLNERIAVLAVVDNNFLPCNLFSKDNIKEDKKTKLNKHGIVTLFPVEEESYISFDIKDEYPEDKFYILEEMLLCQVDDNIYQKLRRNFSTAMTTNLSIVLEPRYPLRARRIEAEKEGKSYCEQYGTAIYGSDYLDLEHSIRNEKNKELRIVLKHISRTKEHLIDTLYEPRGYRAIARVIFEEFFCPLWMYFEFKGDPATQKYKKTEKSGSYTPLGSLIREALDFEDTLRLEGGYREHFVHSYHAFLLGIHLLNKLGSFNIKNNDFIKETMQTWFLISMYHDIGYPIQKLGYIANKYLERLNHGGTGGDIDKEISIGISIGYDKLLASGLFGARLRNITDTFVDEMFIKNVKGKNNVRKKNFDSTKDLLKSICTDFDHKEYKKGLKQTFFHNCLRLALEKGEHGIISTLFFDRAARAANLPEQFRYNVNVAILGHHMYDGDGEWQKILPCTPKTKSECPPWEKTDEIADSIGWDPAWFIYDLNHIKKPFHSLSALLVLCDTFSQWGRSKSNNNNALACLRKRSDKDSLVVICYPNATDVSKIIKYYNPQLERVTGPAREQFLAIGLGRESCKDIKATNKCGDCEEKSIAWMSPLCSEPRLFVDQSKKDEDADSFSLNNS